MATNVSFFRDFAEDKKTVTAKNTEYYFEHSRESLDYSNLFDTDREDDDQIKMFHFTRSIDVIKNDSSYVKGVKYSGSIYMLLKSDIDETIDVQKGVDSEEGKYELYVKSMIENGGLIKQIIDFNSCNTEYEISFSDIREIYNFLGFNGDGIGFKYELMIDV